ncbi:hypothetical protein SALGADO_39 [Arthrobacter phage Salgado]|uniref:Uncharacterized protein n=1 Tax=Arthrobacter phage Salgado TaxID=1772314 RepID=A0A0U4INZ4_9CAUD|nr:hypothetical protein KMD22_gp39 [Arthrobacter phage Salgado]ALY10207.1 hypothetical protein SALGADO_39 [Arthrobacter phage Salgado]
MLYRAARWWYSPILCGALGSAVSMTARKLGNPVSPSLAAALLVTAICAAISLILILGVSRVFRARKNRREALAAANRADNQRLRDAVNGRYTGKQKAPEPTIAEKQGAVMAAVLQNIADASSQQRTAATKTLLEDANALRQSNTPLRRPTPTPAEVRRRAESLAKRSPSRSAYRPSSGYTPHFPSVVLTDASTTASREDDRRASEAASDAMLGAVAMSVAMDSFTAPSYTPSESSYSSPSPSYDSSPSSSYDGGGSFGGGDSGSF